IRCEFGSPKWIRAIRFLAAPYQQNWIESIHFCYFSRMPAERPVERHLRKDAERNRRQILDAARTLFAERGLDVTLNDIAHFAGVGVGTVYRRFPDGDRVIEELFAENLERVVSVIEPCLEDPDPWRGLTSFLETVIGAQAQDRAMKELVFAAPGGLE